MRVNELAKELGRTSKELLEILKKHGIEGKTHSSGLTEEQSDLIRSEVASQGNETKKQPAQNAEPVKETAPEKKAEAEKKPEAEKKAEPEKKPEPEKKAEAGKKAEPEKKAEPVKKAETEKKAEQEKKTKEASTAQEQQPQRKKIAAVYRPQNSQTMKTRPQNGRAQGQNNQQGRPGQQSQAPRDRRTLNQGQTAPRPQAQQGRQSPSQARPGDARQAARPQSAPSKDASSETAQAPRTVNEPDKNRVQGQVRENAASSAQRNQNAQNNQRPQGQTSQNRESREGTKPQGQGYQNREGSRLQGQGYQNRDGSRPQGQGYQNRDGQRGRTQAQGRQGRDGSRVQGYQDRDAQAQRGQGYQGNKEGQRGQGQQRGQRDSRRSFESPMPSKPQSSRNNKNQYKNDRYDKKNMTEDGPKNNKGKTVSKHPFVMPQKPAEEKVEETIKVITIPEVLTIKDLADKMKLQPSAIIKKLFMKGTVVTVNQEIDFEQAEDIAMEFDVLCEKEEKVDVIAELLKEEDEDEKDMVPRPPVVCVMGHVDHGKTSLLDKIRQTNVTAKEAGGITQAIGAYMAEINGQKITFLDTPGHEAFTAMRMRGAQATDIAVLVVAADDGVMPQTVEAINHAKAANVDIIVAVNKIDKPSANVERVKQEMSEYELVPEDWGGNTIFVPVSAKTGEGIDELLEMILLTAEVKELKANPNRNARGLVIEAELDKGKGPVATVLVQKGTLHVGDHVAAGSCYGKVRAMMDDRGRRVKKATPSTTVEILGLNGVPNAGEVFMMTDTEKEARAIADTYISESRNKLLEETKSRLSLDDLFDQIKAGNVKELPIIVKADVQGSVEAVKQSLEKLSNDEVVVKVIHGGVGAINESDVTLASASNAIIIGFNVHPDATAKSTAERENVDMRLYKVIYQAIEDVESAMKGMLEPIYEEQVIGHAVVRQIFKASSVGNIAGSYVTDGKIQRGCKVRVSHEGTQIYEGSLASLKRFKDDVKEVAAGYECGLVFNNFNDFQVDDEIEAYIMVEVPR